MTDKTSPDLLDLAEAVARDNMRPDDAERQVDSNAESVRELRGLIAAARAVRSHAQATRDAAASGSIASASPAGAIGTVIAGPVRPGAARRYSSNGGEHQPRRRTWLLAVAALLVGTSVIGAALIGGGLTAPTRAPSNVLADPSANVVPAAAASWTLTGSLARPGEADTATLLHDGRVLVIHVYRGDDKRYPAELYDPARGSWTPTGSTFGESWAVALLDGRVLTGSELYDPGTGSYTATGSNVAVHQDGATVTRLADGRVLLAGGFDDRYPPKGVTASAELYDPASGRWTATGSMVTPRADHTATLLPDGKVLVAGGDDWENPTATAELYDPATGTWTATAAMSRPLAAATAVVLRDGIVLVADFALTAPCAAAPCSVVFVAELYDPAAGTWTATESTPTPHYARYTATLLPDGRLLVAGGADSGSEGYGLLASSELYEPGTGSWTTTATMTLARSAHTATLLLDGRVLVAGGEGGGTSAELYDPGAGN